ncbi:MAG TPA: AMP-binding protein [Nocardioides sp.]|uniref:AMP-binding protein n=1 Tax=Nocardioides sp. TaxID=35761 RepID=UPI002F400325
MAGAAKVSVAGVAERREALERRHRPWRGRSLAALLDEVAAEHPDRAFVITDDGTWTYRELSEWSRAIGRGLVDRGVKAGEHVAVVLPNGPETIAVKFAIARAGAVAVPVNILLKAEELGYVLGQSRSVALVTMEEFRGIDALETLDQVTPGWENGGASETLPDLRLVVTVPKGPGRSGQGTASRRPGVLDLAGLAHDPDPALDAELDRRTAAVEPGDTASIFYTSGTTGQAKGVISTHDMELRSAYGSAYTRAFEDGRRILFALPLHHVFAYVEGLLASMFVAGAVVVQAAFDPKATLEAVEKHGANEALFVPTMSLAIVDAARGGGYDLGSLHSVMSAAASAPARLWQDLNEVLGVEQLVTAYGMTETAAATTFTMPGDPIEHLVDTVGNPKLGGIAGDPGLDGRLAEYRTVDPTGALLPDGEEGELVARGPIITPGYFDKPRETAEATLADGWLRSGDLGIVREDGYLVLTGRSKELYKCGGELVMPGEVEARLTRLPDVAQAHVVGVPDERMGEVGCAWIVPTEGATPDADALVGYCSDELARFKVPKYVLFTTADRLPLTASGKVQKFRLAQQATEQLGLAEQS